MISANGEPKGIPCQATRGIHTCKSKKPGVAKKCMYQGITYGSIKDACKAAGITVNYYYSHPEIIAKTLAEGVETIEIRKVSRVGRKWLPVEAHTSSNA